MAKYYVMGNFSQKGHNGLLTGDSNRESIVKSGCEALGCKFISYDVCIIFQRVSGMGAET